MAVKKLSDRLDSSDHLEEVGLDSWHGERDRLDGAVQDPERSGELDGPDVADVLLEEGQALVESGRSVRRQREEMRRVFGHLKGRHDAVTLLKKKLKL